MKEYVKINADLLCIYVYNLLPFVYLIINIQEVPPTSGNNRAEWIEYRNHVVKEMVQNTIYLGKRETQQLANVLFSSKKATQQLLANIRYKQRSQGLLPKGELYSANAICALQF